MKGLQTPLHPRDSVHYQSTHSAPAVVLGNSCWTWRLETQSRCNPCCLLVKCQSSQGYIFPPKNHILPKLYFFPSSRYRTDWGEIYLLKYKICYYYSCIIDLYFSFFPLAFFVLFFLLSFSFHHIFSHNLKNGKYISLILLLLYTAGCKRLGTRVLFLYDRRELH